MLTTSTLQNTIFQILKDNLGKLIVHKHDDQRSILTTSGPPTMDPPGLGATVLKLK